MTHMKRVAIGCEIQIKVQENVSMRWFKVLCRDQNPIKIHKQNSHPFKMDREQRINSEEPLRAEQSWLMKTSATVDQFILIIANGFHQARTRLTHGQGSEQAPLHQNCQARSLRRLRCKIRRAINTLYRSASLTFSLFVPTICSPTQKQTLVLVKRDMTTF